MWRIIIVVAVLLYIVYMLMALLQSFGLVKFTNRKITTGRMLVPFYYWFAPTNEKTTKNQNKTNAND